MFKDSYVCSVPFSLHGHNSALELALVVGPAAAFVVLIVFTIIIAVIVIVLGRRYRGQFAIPHCPHISHHLWDGTVCMWTCALA